MSCIFEYDIALEANHAMKRVHGVVLLFSSLLIFWMISNGALVRDIALSLAGFFAAMLTALAITSCLCFLTQCAMPQAIAALLQRLSPRAWARAVSRTGSGRCLDGNARVHNTQREQH
jgi:hypothetical protein